MSTIDRSLRYPASRKFSDKIITVIGLGLIGGSMAITLKDKGFAGKVIGVDANKNHEEKALALGIVDQILPFEQAVEAADIIALTIPVNAAVKVLPKLLDLISDEQVVFDAGSTKHSIIEAIANHPKRRRFMASHPMWGTEYSGPEAVVRNGFVNKATIICGKENTDTDVVEIIEALYQTLGMYLVYMDADAHDVHVAYISHISHITSFALANTVLEKEKEEAAIFELASAGFESTVRLAKSSPAMWVPILAQNRDNVLDVLNEHISQLRKFKACLEKENYEYLQELMENANTIKRIIK